MLLAATAVKQVDLDFGLGARLVDVLQRLERQHRGTDIARLAIPDQFHFALVFKQYEAVFFGQWLSLLDQSNQIALLRLAQVIRLLF